MSNFNITNPNANRSAISLGGEFTNRDRHAANKYKIGSLASIQRSKEKVRPKSQPNTADQTEHVSFYEPPQSAPLVGKGRCQRFYEVEKPKSARKALENHLPLKKNKGLSSGSSDPSQEYALGPGMKLSRSRSKMAVTIDTGLMELPKTHRKTNERFCVGVLPHSQPSFFSAPSTPYQDPERDSLIFQLQNQVTDLTLYLEEERMNHKNTREKAAANLKLKLKHLEERYKEEIDVLVSDHREELGLVKQLQKKELEHQKNASDSAYSRLKGEMEFLQGAFEAYKTTLAQDMEEKWKKREGDLKILFQEEMDKQLHELKSQLIEEKLREKNIMTREFHRQLQLSSTDHKKEIDSMLKKFLSTSDDVQNLKKALEHLKSVQGELDETIGNLAVTKSQLAETKSELTDTKRRLIGFEENFQEKVDEVDDKYKQRINNLMTENTELRKRYMQKCDQLFDEKSQSEVKRIEKLSSTKEIMQMLVHVKNRSNVSITCSDPNTDNIPKLPFTRPSSAPITKREERKAIRSAGETAYLTGEEDQGYTPLDRRPRTTHLTSRAKSSLDCQNDYSTTHLLPL
ncbi:WEB family protein At4g27595, chloroplastic-like isoform X2 [Anneissia japonica]|uniref:WEB family protein At4g27595, chloroplastic-like isoform X2 n=1 Tax=Anneissia japonica TaxID=1529436 RepID=UPI0014256D48|nr:WEB family protein At4g27595, chloroplastic-like isoform X2 [Anneissia japonica]